ncbi:MAG TPA: hypothetical protein VFS20_34050 [Longimicrobium sp.]|nr:hypothetical protein [Longimicrobium sp.]
MTEFDGPAAIALWYGCRDAALWARADERANLFAFQPSPWAGLLAQLDPRFAAVVPSLLILSDLPDERRDAGPIARAVVSISEWCEEQSKFGTAAEYAQAAALVEPDVPMHAARTARVLKERAEWKRSASWYDYALYVAKRNGNWEAYADAYCGLGGLHAERGNLPHARRLFQRALRVAIRHHVDEQVANASHYLFTMEAVAGKWERAEAHVLRALEHYAPESPRRPRLARDLAYRWILGGCFDRALPLAQEVLKHFSSPALRALVWSDIARAAAGAGEDEIFEHAWAQAKVLVDAGAAEPYRITILLNLAHGAAFRGEVARAKLPAGHAADLARHRGEPQSLLEADALLDSLHSARRIVPEPVEHRPGDLLDQILRLLQESGAAA